MGLCSCHASCLAWDVQHWNLLVIEWSWVLALRWRSLGELSPIDITLGQEVSGGPMSWIRLSHLSGSCLTPAGAPRPCQPHSQVCGQFLAFWEVWGLLPAFSRCSVGVVAHVVLFLMYSWGGRWSPSLTPPPSWRSSCYCSRSNYSVAHSGTTVTLSLYLHYFFSLSIVVFIVFYLILSFCLMENFSGLPGISPIQFSTVPVLLIIAAKEDWYSSLRLYF